MITITTNLIEVAEMHKELLNLSIEDTFELYSIFCIEMGANLITIDDILFVNDDVFLYNYSKCFFIFLNYLLEKKYNE